MMQSAKLSEDGRIMLPADVQARLKLVPGNEVVFEERENGDVIMRKGAGSEPIRKSGDIRDLKGILPKPKHALAIEEQSDGSFLVRKEMGDIRDLKGFLKARPGFAPTLEELDEGIARAVSERDARSR